MVVFNSNQTLAFFALRDENQSVLEVEVVSSLRKLTVDELEDEALYAFGFDTYEDLKGYEIRQISREKYDELNVKIELAEKYLASRNKLEALRLKLRKKARDEFLARHRSSLGRFGL